MGMIRCRGSWLVALTSGAMAVLPGITVWAQQPALPTTILPDVRLQDIPSVSPPPQAPQLSIPPSGPTAAPEGAEAIRFRLTELSIEGVSAYPAGRFAALSDPLLNTDVSLSQLYRLASEIQQTYREDGYFLTRVIVPQQTIADGRFRIQVVEGFINGIDVEGDIGAVEDLVREYLSNVVDRRPIRLKTLERYLLLCNDIPGVNVQGVLRASKQELGAAQLVARVSRKPFDALILVDNYADQYTGNWQTAAAVASNSLTSLGEQVSVTGLLTRPLSDPFNLYNNQNNQWVTQFNTSWRLGGDGLFAETLVAYGNSRPGFVLKDFDIDSTTLLLNFDVGYPFYRSRDFSLTSRFGFTYENLDTDIFGGERFTRDRIRVLYLDNQIQHRDAWRGNNRLNLGVRQGIPVFGATEKGSSYKSREDGTNDATVLLGSVSRQQPVYDGFEVLNRPAAVSVFGSVSGQAALFNSLLADELFSLGGTPYGLGYDQGELSGDSGVGAAGELQFTQQLNLPYFESYQIFGFYNYGRVWNRSGGGDEDLSSAGGGIRVSVLKAMTMDLTVAKPLTLKSERSSFGKDPQVLFRVVNRF